MNTTCIRRTSESVNTSSTDDSKALHDAMEEMIDQAQRGFHDLRSMAKACAALVCNSEHGETDEDLIWASNLMHQLAKKAHKLAAVTDAMGARQKAKGGAE